MKTMHECNFNLGPVSINLVDTNLYLGGLAAAKDIVTLNNLKITHILTIDTCPLPRQITELKDLTTKFIMLSDQPKEDLLYYFDDAIDFIESGVLNGNVLVHCYFGVSRSATIVIAYMMKKYKLQYVDALQKVKLKRSIVYPNHGFVSQLQLYEEMGYQIDKNYMKYKLFRLSLAADRFKKVKILPHSYYDCIKPDPGLVQSQPESKAYRCKKCRRIVAGESNLLIHMNKDEICRETYFIEPLQWMNVAQTQQGKLHCPKCENKLGSFSWVMGCQCPCGAQIAPAFYLRPSKIDFTDVVKNVEVTF